MNANFLLKNLYMSYSSTQTDTIHNSKPNTHIDTPYKTWTHLEILTETICLLARQSEGTVRATRVLIETLTPGLRYIHAMLKESLNMAQQRAQAEVEVHLQKQGKSLTVLSKILHDIRFLEEYDWWQAILEVAECGAQRDVLTKLIYKHLGQNQEVAELRTKWWQFFVKKDGLKPLIENLTKDKTPEEKLPIEEIFKVAVSTLNIPTLSTDHTFKWLVCQKKWLEAIMTRSWGAAQTQLKSMVTLAPRDANICLYWSLIKCTEGATEEAFKGILRAHKIDPKQIKIAQLKDEVIIWQMALQEAKKEALRVAQEKADALREIQHNSPNELGFANTVALDGSETITSQYRHVNSSAKNLLSDDRTLSYKEVSKALLESEAWQLPTSLLQVLVDLGPQNTSQMAQSSVLQNLYQNLLLQRAHINQAFERYPQASVLTTCQNQLKICLSIIEHALQAHQNAHGVLPVVDHSNALAHTLALQPELQLEPADTLDASVMDIPPPLPQGHHDTHIPTQLLNAVNPIPYTLSDSTNETNRESISLEIDAPLDFTLEPEENDLARAQNLIRIGELTQAENCLLSLLDKNPFDALVHNDLGVLYFQQQRFGDAKTHLILAIETIPSYEEAWSNLVELCASLGQLHHIVPLFKRFHTLVDSSPGLKNLKELCDRYTPEGTDSLNPPSYEDTIGLKLPLSGSFFIAPAADESIQNAISSPVDDWLSHEKISEDRQKAQQEMAVQMRAGVNALLDNWIREGVQTVSPQSTGVLGWIKNKLGNKAAARSKDHSAILEALAQKRLQEVDEIDEVDEQEMQSQATHDIRELPEDLHRIRNITFSMLCVPSGTFKMGTSEKSTYGCANEYPQHRVVMSRPFQLSRFPVTQELYEAVTWRHPSPNRAPGHPVVRVSWFDAIRFCNTLSDLEGLPAAYQISKGARPEVAILSDSQGYRLPTEAEWEYCARSKQFFAYAGSNSIEQVGWAQVDRMHTVGRKEPNAWGFYDLSGNIWEWCDDGMRDYNRQSQLDPLGERYTYMHTPSARVIRGGSWCFEHDGARVAFRGRGAPGLRISSLGFRIARSL